MNIPIAPPEGEKDFEAVMERLNERIPDISKVLHQMLSQDEFQCLGILGSYIIASRLTDEDVTDNPERVDALMQEYGFERSDAVYSALGQMIKSHVLPH